ncbi:MAG: urease accessory protein UreD [Notoacmeibacter sp.]|nr:urease accessory protein UreD [Notoacmeibacter sp.]MCC0032334.1 urease accessory protein UreD [Brucellaceae bacterium]
MLAEERMQRAAGEGRIAVRHHLGRTRLDTFYQQGAAKIRVPRHAGRDDLEAVIINTAGGLTGGDRLDWSARAGPGATLTLTTQACEKVYKSSGGMAQVRVSLEAAEGARLNWLPQETILFDRAQLSRNLEADLAPDASLLAVEAVIFGRQARGETVREAVLADRWRIRQGGRLIHGEDLRVDGDVSAALALPAVTGGGIAVATVLFVDAGAGLHPDRLRALIAGHDGVRAGASFWHVGTSGKLLARFAARDGYSLRKALVPALDLLTGQARLPKMWSF